MKRVLLWYLGVGLILLVVWNLILLGISLLFGFEGLGGQGPTLLAMLVFAVVMAVVVAGAVAWAKPRSDREAYGLSIVWTLIVLAANLVVTIGNQTTDVFFGRWYVWLVFLAMAAAPILLKVFRGGASSAE